MTARNWKINWRLLVLPLLLLMTACAGQPATSSGDLPKPPSKPAARQPAPPQPYSVSAAQRIETWQQRLTDTLPMSDSAKPPGQTE